MEVTETVMLLMEDTMARATEATELMLEATMIRFERHSEGNTS